MRVELPFERRRRSERRVQIERRRKNDRRSGGLGRPSVAATVESAREHIANAIQMFSRVGSGPNADPEWSGVVDAALSRLTRALAELEAGRT